MSWGCHPDTMSMAAAEGAALAEVGNAESIDYRKAYRRFYAEQNREGEAGLAEYLAELDEEIEWLESGKTLDELNEHRRRQFFIRKGRADLIGNSRR
ncbi:hypothetical protein [Vibrio harveyi]|uniref:hypothetical protein n=1 Tax=Vibrio harveyi TaxID=669 RepID=UPI003CF8855B